MQLSLHTDLGTALNLRTGTGNVELRRLLGNVLHSEQSDRGQVDMRGRSKLKSHSALQ